MVSDNKQILTRGKRKLSAKRAAHRVESIEYNPDDRTEYLTGFHKRKLQRKADAKRKAEEYAHKLHLVERNKMREERNKAVTKGLDRLKEAQDIIEGRRADVNEEEIEEVEEQEFLGFEDDSGILKKKRTTVDGAQVIVEPIQIDAYVDMSKAEEVLAEATRKANEYAVHVQGLERVARQREQQQRSRYNPAKPKQKKKKFRYQRL